jgi:hypothetical protein
MSSHFELSDEFFEEQFQNCQLNPALINHKTHFETYLGYTSQNGIDKAIENISNQLFAFSVSLSPIKFKKTIWWQLKPSTLTILKKQKHEYYK